MTTISDFLAPDHQLCDKLFATAEADAVQKKWDKAAVGFKLFKETLKHHFSMEEEIMFPAFEASTGITLGPTSVMRSEHLQMIGLLNQMSDAVDKKDREAYLGDADTLLIIMEQHNVKEEQMLYRMADQALAGEVDEVVERMRAMA
jgi:hemerythrin-like domain-containing protein